MLRPVAITGEEIEREKKTLPFGWGRFGKAFDHLSDISEPDESLIATCVGPNPTYQYKPGFVPGTLLGAGHASAELTKTMNILLASRCACRAGAAGERGSGRRRQRRRRRRLGRRRHRPA